MKAKQVYRIAKAIWLPALQPLGFAEKNGEYFRLLDSGVVHLIGIGKDPHGAKTFRTVCGVDAKQLQNESRQYFGYKKKDCLYHLTPKGWDYNSGRWPCETEEETRASVNALLPLILDLAIPYFEPITTLSDVGDEINEVRMPHLLWMKARLFLLDGAIPQARTAIEKYAAWADKPRNWGTKEHQQEDVERAARIRAEIETVALGMGK